MSPKNPKAEKQHEPTTLSELRELARARIATDLRQGTRDHLTDLAMNVLLLQEHP